MVGQITIMKAYTIGYSSKFSNVTNPLHIQPRCQLSPHEKTLHRSYTHQYSVGMSSTPNLFLGTGLRLGDKILFVLMYFVSGCVISHWPCDTKGIFLENEVSSRIFNGLKLLSIVETVLPVAFSTASLNCVLRGTWKDLDSSIKKMIKASCRIKLFDGIISSITFLVCLN